MTALRPEGVKGRKDRQTDRQSGEGRGRERRERTLRHKAANGRKGDSGGGGR